MAYTQEQLQNARIIAEVGRSVGASERDIQIALAVSLQESGLRNLNYGDRDSLGLFQQRPSMDWGSRSQVTDPRYAARAFFLGAGTNKGLLDYGQRDSWSLTQAAQRVQRSAFPDAYAKHEGTASELLSAVGGGGSAAGAQQVAEQAPVAGAVDPTTATAEAVAPGVEAVVAPGAEAATAPGIASTEGTTAGIVNTASEDPAAPVFLPELSQEEFQQTVAPGASGLAAQIIAEAKKYLGTPYKWGGTSPLGFDCSGLLQYVYGKYGVSLPRVSYQQANAGRHVGFDEAQAGDIWWIDNSSRNNGADHIGLYLGQGLLLEAPRSGLNVRIRSLSDRERSSGGFTRVL